jgi:hypothetical protein
MAGRIICQRARAAGEKIDASTFSRTFFCRKTVETFSNREKCPFTSARLKLGKNKIEISSIE